MSVCCLLEGTNRESIVPSWDTDGVRDIRYVGVLHLHAEFTDAWFLSRWPTGGIEII